MPVDLGIRRLDRFEMIPKDGFTISLLELANPSLVIGGKTLPQIFSDAALLTSLVKSVELPVITVKDEPINIGSTTTSNINAIDIDDLVIMFYVDIDNLAEKMYYAWLSNMFDFSTNTKKPRLLYERNIGVNVYSRYGKKIREYIFYNCSPRSPGQKIRLDYEEEGYVEAMPITFKVNNGIFVDL